MPNVSDKVLAFHCVSKLCLLKCGGRDKSGEARPGEAGPSRYRVT